MPTLPQNPCRSHLEETTSLYLSFGLPPNGGFPSKVGHARRKYLGHPHLRKLWQGQGQVRFCHPQSVRACFWGQKPFLAIVDLPLRWVWEFPVGRSLQHFPLCPDLETNVSAPLGHNLRSNERQWKGRCQPQQRRAAREGDPGKTNRSNAAV